MVNSGGEYPVVRDRGRGELWWVDGVGGGAVR